MPPRYSYWTIIAGGLPTAFRAAERDELMPTFTRLRQKHPDAEMRWFARGKLWDSPDAARRELDNRRPDSREARTRPRRRAEGPDASPERPARDRDWRPGGEHRDPRQKYVDAKKGRNLERRKQKFARKHGDDRPARGGDEPRSPDRDRPPAGRDRQERFGDGPRNPRGPRTTGQGGGRGDQGRNWSERPPHGGTHREGPEGRPRGAGTRPWSKPRDAGDRGEQRSRDRAPGRGADARQSGWKSKPPGGGAARPWSKPRDGTGARPASGRVPEDARGGSGREGPSRPKGPDHRDRPPQREWDARGGSGREGPSRPKGPDQRNRPPQRDWQGRGERDRNDRPPRGGVSRDGQTDRGSRDGGTAPSKRPWEDRGSKGGGQGRFPSQRPAFDKGAGGWRPREPRDKPAAAPRPRGGGTPDRGGDRAPDDRGREPANRRRFEPPSFGRGQGTEEPSTPPRPRGPNREPRPGESPAPSPPPRPSEPETTPPGPPERGRLVKKPRRP